MLQRTVCPKNYDGLRSGHIRQSLRRGSRYSYDPVPPMVIVPPPVHVPDTCAAPCVVSQQETWGERLDMLFAEAMAKVKDLPIYDPTAPTDFYTDGSCLDNGRPWACAGWGVCVENSDQLGEFFGAVPDTVQTNNRAELVTVEAALQLAWNSKHSYCRVFADCNLACMTISNDEAEWAWRKALGVSGWMARWEHNGWRTASGKRVRHAGLVMTGAWKLFT